MSEARICGSSRGYTVIYRSALMDERLSLKTIGLFAIMRSFPDTWEYSVSGLASRARVGRDVIRQCLRELEAAGYLIREQERSEDGKFSSATYMLREWAEDEDDCAPDPDEEPETSPLTENPSTAEDAAESVSPLTEKPTSDNPAPEKPTSEKPTSENRPQDINHLSKPQSKKLPPKAPQGGGAKWKPERFEAFWNYYRRVGRGEAKQKAVRAWDKLKPDDELIAVMGRALRAQCQQEDWLRGVGVPYASSWLNGRRWEDDLKAAPFDRPDEPEVFGWQ